MSTYETVDADELAALRRIAQAANEFVNAINTDEQIDAVSEQANPEWCELAASVIDGRAILTLQRSS